jgi:hypothetical protein
VKSNAPWFVRAESDHNPSHPYYLIGDIILFENTGWLQRIISIFATTILGRGVSEDGRVFKRAAVVSSPGHIDKARVIECRPWGVVESPLARHEGRIAVAFSPERDVDLLVGKQTIDAMRMARRLRFKRLATALLLLESMFSEYWSFMEHDPSAWLVRFIYGDLCIGPDRLWATFDVHEIHKALAWEVTTGRVAMVHGVRRLFLKTDASL